MYTIINIIYKHIYIKYDKIMFILYKTNLNYKNKLYLLFFHLYFSNCI